MAVYSMTGYASGQLAVPSNAAESLNQGSSNGLQLGVEIRSVNSRFLDLSFRLPDELRQSEPALRTLLTQHLKRGKVELRASLEMRGNQIINSPNADALLQLQKMQQSIQQIIPSAAPLSVADVLRFAGGQTTSNQTTASQHNTLCAAAVLTLCESVVADLLSARQHEGARLAAMLQNRVSQLRALAALAEPMIPQLVAQQQQKFLARWQEALAMGSDSVLEKNISALANSAGNAGNANNENDENDTKLIANTAIYEKAAMERALSEATAFAIRIDVAEELTRLASHLDEIERLLTKGGENGKRLDFLIQELHREANTLGSKSSVLELSRISVDMKVLIEQMREQVQNIE